MPDDIDYKELEQRLFPEGTRISEWTAEDLRAFGERVRALYDQYGEDRISKMIQELMAGNAGQARAYAETLHRATGGTEPDMSELLRQLQRLGKEIQQFLREQQINPPE
jgi:hypothetical protein